MGVFSQLVLLVILNATCCLVGVGSTDICHSPQYLELGKTGTINCVFQEEFFGIYWYDTTDYENNDPFIHYNNIETIGAGYESGEFDVHPNGSLIIENVTLSHERIFTVAYVHTKQEGLLISEIQVIVFVKPEVNFPHINACGNTTNFCFSKHNLPLHCYVREVRPNVTLKWMARQIVGDKDIHSEIVTTRGHVGYTTRATVTDVFHSSPLLLLLVCKASGSPTVLQNFESMILYQRKSVDLSHTPSIVTYAERNSQIELPCTDDPIGFFVWKKINSFNETESEVLLYAVLIGEQYTEIYVENISLNPNSSLEIIRVDQEHEGTYICIFGDGITDGWITYDVKVIVNPTPGYPVIDGCNHQHYCVLEVKREGTLTCKVTGIRPQIQLQWKAFHDSDEELISFTNQQLIVKENGGTFDVSLTATYYVIDTSRDRLTIECKEPEPENKFHLTTKLDLIFTDFNPMEEDGPHAALRNLGLIIPVIGVTILLLTVFGIITLKHISKQKGQDSETTPESNEEVIKMLPEKSYDVKTILDPKEVFLKQIKEKYKDWYDAVQPIPYIRDRLYCVDKVFVEGGMEYLDSVEGIGGRRVWKRLETYENVFNASQVSSPRRILEGEPGYGKSTVTLQFAYDWCNPKPTSALKDVEILILLRLRQLGGVPSIYKAIKRFILPRDTAISETDIDHILRNSKSVVVILDGFDEYPDKDSTTITDVMTIIARQMFQDFEVVTTTRSSFLPKKYPPLTKRIRLTGFYDKARRYYIRKAVVGDDDDEGVRKIERYLADNPILSDLCQVPLLFVIFAHMTYESEHFRKLNSVTSFFRHMISCFHSHMRNKMDEENVRKYEMFETTHQNLDKMAFEAFSGQSQKIVWNKDEMCQLVGQEFYDQYIRIGILVEEESVDIIDDPGTPITEHVQYKTEVRFYHKLFCEWYAAHYLTNYLQQNPTLDLDKFLQHLDPFDVQYLYRFACGINSDSAERIIDYLKNIEGGDKFAILCILEQTGKIDNIKETIRQLCDEGVIISGHDTLLLQRSSMQLLEMAAKNEIPIELVVLHNCLQSVELSTPSIKTTSGLAFTPRIPFKELHVNLYNRDMTEDEAIDILQFASLCPSLLKLAFYGTIPPQVFKDDSSLATLNSKKIEVFWQMFNGDPLFILNLETGRWQGKKDGEEPTPDQFEKMRAGFTDQVGKKTEGIHKEDIKKMRNALREKAERQPKKIQNDDT